MISGGVILGGSLVARAVMTGFEASSVPECRRKEREGDLDDLECDLGGIGLTGLMTTPPIALGAGLLAGGFARRGKWDALNDHDAHRVRNRQARMALGWSLFTSGMMIYTATRFIPFACPTYQCEVGVWEGGFWAGAAMAAPGLMIASHATAYERTKRKHHQLARWLTPVLSVGPRASMIGIAGRF